MHPVIAMSTSIETSPLPTGYTATAQWLHWLIAALIIAQYVLAELAEGAAAAHRPAAELLLLANHKSLGMTILALAIIRLCWRLGHPSPDLPGAMPRWQNTAASIVHRSIYGLIFALPISGWLLSSAAGYSVSWFGVLQWPDLVAANPTFKEQLSRLHHWLSDALFVVVVLHVLATLKHQWLDQNRVFQRMYNRPALAASIAMLLSICWLLGISISTAIAPAYATPNSPPPPPMEHSANGPAVAPADPPELWNIDYTRSEIRFIAEQAGARFSGTWNRWQAQIHFSQQRLDDSTAQVTIAADSAATNDADRDATITTSDWFAATTFPTIRYDVQHISKVPAGEQTGQRLAASGILHIKQHAVPVDFLFSVTASGKQRTLEGTARLDRLALGLGLGEWADPATVGQFVQVSVTVVATVP